MTFDYGKPKTKWQRKAKTIIENAEELVDYYIRLLHIKPNTCEFVVDEEESNNIIQVIQGCDTCTMIKDKPTLTPDDIKAAFKPKQEQQ